jgi:HK97 family phage portal protein
MAGLAIIRRKGLFGITWGSPGASSWDYAQQWSRGLDLGAPETITEPYAKHPVVASALSIFVADAASVGWELYREGNDDDPIEKHPVLDLLDKPSPRYSGFQLHIGSFLSYMLFGEAWWYFPDVTLGSTTGLRATGKNAGEILMLDPRAVRRDERGRWVLMVRGEAMPLDERRLMQVKRWNPYNPDRGLSVIDSVLMEVETDHAAAGYNRAFFRDQHGVPTGLLIPSLESPGGTSEQRQEWLKKFNTEAASQRRRIGMIPPGWAWQDIGISMKDMEFGSLREYSRELILSAIGVPPFMCGVLDKANYANAREQREAYWLGPQTRFLAEWQDALNSLFLVKLGVTGIRLFPCWETVKSLVENLGEKVDIAGKLFAMGFTKRQINERLELGMQVDDLEDADVGYLPFTVAPVSTIMDPPNPVVVAPPDATDTGDGEDPDPAKSLTRAETGEDRERRRATRWRSVIAQTRDLERVFNRVIRRHLQEIESEVLGKVNGLKGWLAVQQKDASDDLLFDAAAAKKKLAAQAAPVQRLIVKRGGDSLVAELGAVADFDLMDLRVNAKLLELSRKITRIDDTIETALRESMNEGLLAGESPQQLASRVRDVMSASKARSMTIARTETGFAFNTGRHEGMRQNGVELQEWLTARDSKVRDSHVELDGEIVGIGDTFSNGLRYPLDPSGPADEVINCRCTPVPVVGRG